MTTTTVHDASEDIITQDYQSMIGSNSSGVVNNTSTGVDGRGAGGGGMTSLLEKYATLNNAITNTRSQITQTQNVISTLSNELSTLQTQSESIQNKTKSIIQSSIPSTKYDYQIIFQEYNTMVERENDQKVSLQIEKEVLEKMKLKCENDRREFLNQCREFRMNVRRNRVCLESLINSCNENGGQPRSACSSNHDERQVKTSDEVSCSECPLHEALDHHRRKSRNNHQISNNHIRSSSRLLYDYEVRIEHPNQYHCPDGDGDNRIFMSKEENDDGLTISTTESTISTSMIWDTTNKTDAAMSTTSESSPVSFQNLSGSSMKKVIKSSDNEVNHAMIAKINASKIRSQVKDKLDCIKREREVITERSRDRSKQLESQRGQLEKVRKDVQDLEREIALLEENTVECRQISEGYAKDAERRRKKLQTNNNIGNSIQGHSFGAVTPSPYTTSRSVTNPYTRKQSDDNSSPSTNAQSHRSYQHSTVMYPNSNIVQNPYTNKYSNTTRAPTNYNTYKSSLAKQHPHRAGRIRVDKQFTTALSISSTNEEDDNFSNDEFEKHSNMSHNVNNDKRSSRVSVDGSIATSKRPQYDNTSSDDDDDDDDLLLFIPFGKDE